MIRAGWDIIVVTWTQHCRGSILSGALIAYELHLRLANSHEHAPQHRAARAISVLIHTGLVVVYSLRRTGV